MKKKSIQDYLTHKTVFFHLKGEINNHNALIFKKSIFSLPEEKEFLVLDLTSLQSITGDGIRVFFESLKYFQKRNGTVILIHPREEIFLLLKFLKLLDYVIIAESYTNAKEMIEKQIQEKEAQFDLKIEEKAIFSDPSIEEEKKKEILEHNYSYFETMTKEKKERENSTNSEIQQLKQDLESLQLKLSRLNQKWEGDIASSMNGNCEKIYSLVEKKFNELKQSNESYFKEINTRISYLNDTQESLIQSVSNLQEELKIVKEDLYHDKYKDSGEKSFIKKSKEFQGYFIIKCNYCKQPLRVKQLGKHLCPKCKKEFNVLPEGKIEFFEST